MDSAELTTPFSLPGQYFRSSEIYAQELEQIFRRRWLYVCLEADLPQPGSYVCLEVGEESVLVVRGKAGVRAFHNLCRHRGTRLCWAERGRGAKALVCPYHAWAYSFEGELIGAANMDELPGFQASDYALHPVHCESLDGLVFVNLGPAPAPLSEVLPGLAPRVAAWRPAELVSVERRVYEVAANWKLFFENYSECYHCPSAHPALNRLTPYLGSSNDLEEGPMLGGPMTLRPEAETMSLSGKACAALLPGLSAEQRRQVSYYTVFPNLFLSLHPDYLLVHRIDPLANSQTRITCDWYFARESAQQPGFDPRPAVDFWDQTNEQDWELCRQAQRGVTTRAYVPGPYAGIERMVAAFDREYLAAMDGSGGESEGGNG